MRVAFVSETTVFHAPTGGNERLHRLASQLADRGHVVTVFCARWWDDEDEGDDERDDERERDGVTYRSLADAPGGRWFSLRLPTRLSSYHPDVVHATPTPASQVTAASVGASLRRAPLVVDWFGHERVPDTRLGRRVATAPDLVVTPSELVRTVVREWGARESATRVIPESIDADRIRNTDPEERADVVYSRQLDEDANLESLLLGLAELRDHDWRALVVGDGPERAGYEQQVEELRIDDRVTFAGALSREERVAVYRGAHTFVQTATREYFATELLWALACGCVGIVEYQAESSAHELIETYDRSFRVTDPQELADAIAEASDLERHTVDEDLTDRYDHGTILERYLQCYRDLQTDRGVV